MNRRAGNLGRTTTACKQLNSLASSVCYICIFSLWDLNYESAANQQLLNKPTHPYSQHSVYLWVRWMLSGFCWNPDNISYNHVWIMWYGTFFLQWVHLKIWFISNIGAVQSVLYVTAEIMSGREGTQYMISCFGLEVDENCAVLGNYTASCGNSLPMFRNNLSVPSAGVKPLKMALW